MILTIVFKSLALNLSEELDLSVISAIPRFDEGTGEEGAEGQVK